MKNDTVQFHVVTQKHDIILDARPSLLEAGSPTIPMRLMYQALWVYDLTNGIIHKNSTDSAVIPCLDAVHVDHDWLVKNGYIRAAWKS